MPFHRLARNHSTPNLLPNYSLFRNKENLFLSLTKIESLQTVRSVHPTEKINLETQLASQITSGEDFSVLQEYRGCILKNINFNLKYNLCLPDRGNDDKY